MRKPNYSQDRLQRERDKAAKNKAKELRKQEKAIQNDPSPDQVDETSGEAPQDDR